jgi:hypothetical protein
MMDIGGQKRLENCTQAMAIVTTMPQSKTYKSRIVSFFSLSHRVFFPDSRAGGTIGSEAFHHVVSLFLLI